MLNTIMMAYINCSFNPYDNFMNWALLLSLILPMRKLRLREMSSEVVVLDSLLDSLAPNSAYLTDHSKARSVFLFPFSSALLYWMKILFICREEKTFLGFLSLKAKTPQRQCAFIYSEIVF